jgi:Ca2+-transporting ATPase
MQQPPRDPKKTIANRRAVVMWFFYGLLIFATSLVPLLAWPDLASSTEPNAPVTMTFVIAALGSIFGGLVMRRDPESGLSAPILTAVKWLAIPLALTVVAVEIGFLQRLIGTVALTGPQWLACLGLALIVPVVVELEKWIRRGRLARHGRPV